MDSSDQRRKRKRILRQPYSHLHLSVRSLVVCLSFLSCLYLLAYTNPFTSSAIHPVLVASSSSLVSSSSSRTVKSVQDFDNLLFPLKIENRVLFPDHVLVLVSGVKKDWLMKNKLDCVYYGKFGRFSGDFTEKKALFVDEYDGFRSVVGCPLPSVNYSSVVNLKLKNGILEEKNGIWMRNQTVNSWENVAYEATVDGETAVVFVKGLNLRPDREYDPSQFTCHFGLGKWKMTRKFTLRTKALTAAQEVVRCSLPKSIAKNLDKAKGIRVTVGVTRRPNKRLLIPSVAKIFNLSSDDKKRERKYKLCVCTMVWNQASFIREWIMYHSSLGVERWFIYDNNSDDGLEEVVQELDRENYNVTRRVWPWIKTQEAGFSHCALKAKDECNWIAFMDVDEYFHFPYSPHRHHNTFGYDLQNSLGFLVGNFSRTIGEIRTSCHSFGPSGLRSPPSKGITVGYTCRLLSPERHKSIIRPDALDSTLLNVVHHFHLKKGFEYINLPQSIGVINHYKYQVWEVFRAKFYRRVATYVADWHENQNEGSRDRAPGLGTEAIEPPNWPQKFCEVWDTGLRDFVLANLVDDSTGLLPWERHLGFD